MSNVCVIGSLNIDMTIALPRFHMPGETISGRRFEIFFGGKGGNQAVALAKLRKNPALVAMTGDDAYGADYVDALKKQGVDAEFVQMVAGTHTGIAMIEIDESSGENRIALAPGANALFSCARLDQVAGLLHSFDIFLLQLEIPMETTLHALRILNSRGKTVILDPAPATKLPGEILANVTYLTPNETELSILTDMPVETASQIERAARSLLKLGAKNVVVKMGARGSMFVRDDAFVSPPFAVAAVDTTAAGDAFNAGFAYALSEGMGEKDALQFANATGALATTAYGAQSAMPDILNVRALIESQ